MYFFELSCIQDLLKDGTCCNLFAPIYAPLVILSCDHNTAHKLGSSLCLSSLSERTSNDLTNVFQNHYFTGANLCQNPEPVYYFVEKVANHLLSTTFVHSFDHSFKTAANSFCRSSCYKCRKRNIPFLVSLCKVCFLCRFEINAKGNSWPCRS